MKSNKSSVFNLDANIVILIAYIGGLIFKWLDTACYFAWAIPLIIYLIESKNEFVKKQSAQAILLYLISSLLSILTYLLLTIFAPNETQDIYSMIITGSLFLIGLVSILSTVVSVIITVFAIVATVKTYNYEDYDIPYLSNYLDKFREYLEKLEGKKKTCKCNNCNCHSQKEPSKTRIKRKKIHKTKKIMQTNK